MSGTPERVAQDGDLAGGHRQHALGDVVRAAGDEPTQAAHACRRDPGHPQDVPHVERMCGIFEARGGRALLVRLVCTREELERRLPQPGRVEAGKLASLETLRELTGRLDLFSPVPGRESLEIDNTDVAPEEVARRIIEHYRLKDVSG